MRSCFLLLACAGLASAQGFQSTNDIIVTGQVGVQMVAPQARLQVQMSTSDAYALRVASSDDATPLTAVDSYGRLGIATFGPQALVDVPGQADAGTVGLWLRSGNSISTTLSSQMTFGMPGDLYRHVIATQHTDTQTYVNGYEFFLWNATAQPTALGTQNVLAIQASMAGSSVSVHIDPVGQPGAELVVSNGLTYGGGSILRAAAGQHMSSRKAKSDIQYLTKADEARAYEDVKNLKHATFRFKAPAGRPRQPLLRGVIYEDSPASIQGAGHTVVFDARLANLEMALKEINRRIAQTRFEIAALEKQRKKAK